MIKPDPQFTQHCTLVGEICPCSISLENQNITFSSLTHGIYLNFTRWCSNALWMRNEQQTTTRIKGRAPRSIILVTTKIYFLLYFLHFLLTSGERLQLTQMTVCVRMFGWNKNMISFLLHLVLMSQFHVHRTLCFQIFQNENFKFRIKYLLIYL